MRKQIYFIIILLAIFGITSKVYLSSLQKKRRVKEFLNTDLAHITSKNTTSGLNNASKIETKELKNEKHLSETNISNSVSKSNKSFLKPKVIYKIKCEIITKPIILKTHKFYKNVIFFQDANLNIYLISMDGKLIWKKPLSEKIISSIYTVDFYKNKRYQYLFSTNKNIFLIDINGNRVSKYPYKLNALQTPKFLSIIDYDDKKNYRISIVTPEGTVYLFDKYMNILKGWNPKIFNSNFVSKLEHCRVKNKDYLILSEDKGKLFFIKRNGAFYKNKIDIHEKLKDIIIDKKNSKIYLLTTNNLILTYDFITKQIKKQNDIGKIGHSEVSILRDEFGSGNFLFYKLDMNEIFVLNKKIKTLFKKSITDAKNATLIDVKYFIYNNHKIFTINFNNELEVYCNNIKQYSKNILSKGLFSIHFYTQNDFIILDSYENEIRVYK